MSKTGGYDLTSPTFNKHAYDDTDSIASSTSSDPEEKCTCLKVSLMICNALFWLSALIIIGLAVSCAADRDAQFLSGKSTITNGLLAYGVLAFLVATVCFLAVVFRSHALTGLYLCCFMLIVGAQIGMIIAAYVIYKEPTTMVEQAWTELSDQLREFYSKQGECCGMKYYNDTYTSLTLVPEACKDSSGVVFSTGCAEAIITYFSTGTALAGLVCGLFALAMIEISTLIFGGFYFHELTVNEEDDVNKSKVSLKRNKVSPLLVASADEQLSTPPMTSRRDVKVDVPKSQPMLNQPSTSASRNELTVSRANTNDELNEDQPKGNEYLFSLANAMLGHKIS